MQRDEARERRIADEIVADAYGEEEQVLGWYYYLEERLAFPFKAKGVSERRISSLKRGEVVEVTGMAPEDDYMHEMFVAARWCGRTLGVPLGYNIPCRCRALRARLFISTLAPLLLTEVLTSRQYLS
jgi:hypothetical protein